MDYVDYVPWPENGCGLGEARDRIAEAVAQDDAERDPNADCLAALCAGRLIAYGRAGSKGSPEQLIAQREWGQLIRIDWMKSSAKNAAGRLALLDIRIFPVLLAPCRSQLIAGLSFADVFKKCILGDPEVAKLAAIAIPLAPDWKRTLVEGRCHPHGIEEWPVSPERWSTAPFAHPDPAKRDVYDGPEIDPIEVVRVAQALLHRYMALLSMLRSGEIVAEGMNHASGMRETILTSIWSHHDFHVDAVKGDLLETNEWSEHSYDRYIKRYIAIAFRRPSAHVPTDASAADVSEPAGSPSGPAKMSHVKPKERDQASASSLLSQPARSTSVLKSKDRERFTSECLTCLIGIMEASPNKRTHTKAQLRQEARKIWPHLSLREFEHLRLLAIDETGAETWRHSGAPRKKPQNTGQTK